MHRFLVVVEEAGTITPRIHRICPVVSPLGATRDETEKNTYEALQLHIEGLLEGGLPIPSSSAVAEYVIVASPN